MTFRILADEHCERKAVDYLRKEGHDVERVIDVPELGHGASDAEIAAYAQREDRLILTSDDDFLAEIEHTEHAGILFQPNERMNAFDVASAVSSIASHIDQGKIDTDVYVTENWL